MIDGNSGAIPPSLSDSLQAQHIEKHQAALRGLGYQTLNISGQNAKLKDLYSVETDTWFECKSDSHPPRNLCIELLGNLADVPSCFDERVVLPSEPQYREALEWLRQQYRESPSKRSLGFSDELEPKHYASYLFRDGSHFCLPIQRLQTELVFPALRESRNPLLRSDSWDCGSWFSVSLLIPVAAITQIAI